MKEINSDEIIWNIWEKNATNFQNKDAIIHWVDGEEPYRWSFSELITTAKKYSVMLKKLGIKKGEVCAIIIRHNKYFHPIYLAISYLGAIPAVLAYPNPRLHPDKFKQGIEGMAQRSGLDYILTERSLENIIIPLINTENSTIKGMYFPQDWVNSLVNDINIIEEIKNNLSTIKPTDPFLLQHSSGTTGLQKPVVLSNKEILIHLSHYSKAIKLSENDKIISWLPLYHDMGLIAAYLLPLTLGITTVQIDTFQWVLAPILLLEVISKEKGTLCWIPNFAYNMMADKIHDDELTNITLKSLRMSINCSEPVRDESHEKFYNRFSKYGLNSSALATSYAMAETTFAVSQSCPGEVVKKLILDRNELSKGYVVLSQNKEVSRVCVSSGKIIDGCEVRIINDNGEELPQGFVGEVVIKSDSLFDGYRNYPEKTKEVLKNGWYYSGDYGFKWEEQLYIIGRKKDIIIVAGNNYYPEDIEDEIGKIEDIISGRVIAFGDYDEGLGTERISLIAETELTDEKDLKKLRLNVIKAAMQIDVTMQNVFLVPPRWLIKSSAGKPSRKINKERILNEIENNTRRLNDF